LLSLRGTQTKALSAFCAILLLATVAAAKTKHVSATKSTKVSTKSSAKATHPTKSTASRSKSSKTTHSTATKRKRSKYSRTARKRGQQSITSDRTREIQAALIREHYMSGEPTGVMDQETKAALTRLQNENGWQTKIVPDSRALIKLGLGPSHEGLLNPDSAALAGPRELGVEREIPGGAVPHR
jgi:hypothetical protein